MQLEKWITIRQMDDIPTDIYFEFFRERSTLHISREEFDLYFQTLVTNGSIVDTGNGVKKITIESAKNNLLNYYDQKFGLC